MQNDQPGNHAFSRTRQDAYKTIVKLLNVLLVSLPFCVCWIGVLSKDGVRFSSSYRSIGVMALFVMLYIDKRP